VTGDFVPMGAVGLLVTILAWRAYLHWEAGRRITALKQFESLFHNNTDAVISLDEDGKVRNVNAAFTRLTGWTVEGVAGTEFVQQVCPEDRATVQKALTATWAGIPRTCETVLVDKKDRVVEVKLTSVPIQVGSKVVGVYQIAQDIRLRREIERKLETQAHHDYLTGLPNRALFQERLDYAFERARQRGAPIALIYIDLDRFKAINDGAGHAAGDKLLQTVASRLGCFLQGGDTVARVGGDEFALLLETFQDVDQVVAVATKITKLFYEPMYLAGRELRFGASIGTAVSTPEVGSPDELVRRADMAMYEAKRRGGHRYEFYRQDLEGRRKMASLQLEGDLREAIDKGELMVNYQPIVDLAGTRIVGVEALARWRHREFGVLGPDRFIPLAEETGLIVPLDRWILRQACREVQKLIRVGGPNAAPLFLSVNYSRLHLDTEDGLTAVSDILRSEGFQPERLQLEITETVAGSDRRKVKELKTLGVRLAIDDFGTGYSSLGYLKDVDVDVLKIDRSLVRTLGTDPSAAAIVRTILTLAEMLKMGVIIEGIEDATQLRQLQGLGGRYVQGFYFAEPMDASALEDLVRRGLPPEWACRLTPTYTPKEAAAPAPERLRPAAEGAPVRSDGEVRAAAGSRG